MKNTVLTTLMAILALPSFAQYPTDIQLKIDSVEKTLSYQHGNIALENGVGNITIPQGFKYLDPQQAERVIVDLWGNPGGKGLTLGMILPENQGVLSDTGYVFNIQYDEIGYVKDDDAGDINYDELLAEMQKETLEANAERNKQGYESITMIGWAAKPFYDKERKILHWAQELKFGDAADVHTLNYNIRILGRKGVLVLNAISTMPNLASVQRDIPNVLNIVQFKEGYQYKDFDSSIDNVAAWTIGGLVAGKVLAKAGFFVILLKFWKLIAIAVVGAGAGIWRFFKGSRNA